MFNKKIEGQEETTRNTEATGNNKIGRQVATAIMDTITGTGLGYLIGTGTGKYILPGLKIPGKILCVIGTGALGIFAESACHKYNEEIINTTFDAVEIIKLMRKAGKAAKSYEADMDDDIIIEEV